MTELEIIQTILNGNTENFRLIAEAYQSKIFRVCMGFVHQKEEAEDLTQDILVSIFQNLNSYKGNSKFSTWIYRIAVNASLRHLERKKRRGFFESIEQLFTGEKSLLEINIHSHNDTPESILTSKERSEMVHRAIDSLSENQRIAFTLSKFDDLPQQQIASIMNSTEGAVEALLQRAKANLQKKLITLHKKK